ncbi:MAG: hypothetical protein U9N53_08065, partial [Bacteroidota bacterium]|nr:hypothetical protein [Bacteroidota bacterium]
MKLGTWNLELEIGRKFFSPDFLLTFFHNNICLLRRLKMGKKVKCLICGTKIPIEKDKNGLI